MEATSEELARQHNQMKQFKTKTDETRVKYMTKLVNIFLFVWCLLVGVVEKLIEAVENTRNDFAQQKKSND